MFPDPPSTESATAPTPPPIPPPPFVLAASNPFSQEDFQLNWSKRDIEQRLGFRGGRFTSVNRWLGFLLGVTLTVIYYGFLIFYLQHQPAAHWFTAMFLERGFTPFPTMLLFFWALAILFLKSQKLRLQAQALNLSAVPQEPDFVLNRESARAVLTRIHSLVDNAGHFLLLNRIERALSNLKNIGQISDVASILRNQADYDEQQISSSYSMVHSFLWAIPVLGFIGTVLGLRQAIGALGLTLRSGGDIDAIRQSLQAVTAGLATKFETTLVALICAVIIQLLCAFMQSLESEFLDECNDYCHAHVTSKLKLMANSSTE
jgi:biopolymer transport protein ExbB/TolQ